MRLTRLLALLLLSTVCLLIPSVSFEQGICQPSIGTSLLECARPATSSGTPGSGTVTSIGTGFGLTGGTITSTGTVSLVAPSATDQVFVSDSTSAGTWRSIPDCQGTGKAMTFTAATNLFGCNTISGSGATPGGSSGNLQTNDGAGGFGAYGGAAACSAGQHVSAISASGATTCSADAGGGSGTPGGSNTQVQYNTSGAFGGSTGLTVDATTILTEIDHQTAVSTSAAIASRLEAVTTSTATITRTLPAASSSTIGQIYDLYKADNAVGTLALAANGTNTLNGVASTPLTTGVQFEGFHVVGISATGWWVQTLVTAATSPVSSSRLINTTSPITGGGNLTADRTIACATCTTSTGALTANAFVTGAGLQGMQAVAITGLVKGNGASVPAAATAGTDYMGLASTNAPTGRQDFSGAASTSPMKVGTSLPGTCTVGDTYFKSDATAGQNIYECQSTNTWTQQLNSGSGGGGTAGATLFSTTASTTVTATSATTLIGAVSGSTTVPINTFTAGQFLQFVAEGYYSTPATPVSLTIDLLVGGSTRLTTGAVVQIASVTNGTWKLFCGLTTRTAGASGTQIGNCTFEATGPTLTPGETPMQTSSTWAIDTTATNVIDLKATWSTATGAPTITATNVAAWIPGAPVTSVNGQTGAVTVSSGVSYTTGADANTAMAVNTGYLVNMSAWATADRTYTLPTNCTVGDSIVVTVTAGNASTFELLLTAASSDTLNGVAGGTEWSRIFQTGESVTMRCVIVNSAWIVESSHLIAQQATLRLSTSATGESAATWTLPTSASGAWTADIDVGSLTTVATGTITVRRSGRFSLTGSGGPVNALSGTFLVTASKNGTTPTIINTGISFISATTNNRPSFSVAAVPLVTTDTVQLMFLSADGTRGLAATASPELRSHLSLVEILP